jgi:hypothetical protein
VFDPKVLFNFRRGNALGDQSHIIDLATYRSQRLIAERKTAYHLSQPDDRRISLPQNPILDLWRIETVETLGRVWDERPPHILFVEASLSWCDPIEQIASVHQKREVPIVLLCPGTKRKELGQKIKRAYMAGATDVLFSPVNPEDLKEIIEVLLKIELPPNSHH